MIDLIIVAGYFALMLAVGWRARRGTPDAYWVASRRSGTARVSASLAATIFGASSTVGIIGLGYGRGLTGAWWSLIGGLALIPFAFLLAGRVRSLGVYTLPDVLQRAYGRRVSVLGGILIALAWCGVVAAQLVAGALLLGSVFSLDLNGALFTVTVVFVLYTLWGGQLSVIRTDFWQLLLFVGGLVTVFALVLRSGVQVGDLMARIPSGHLAFPVAPGFGWYQVLVFYPLIIGLPYLVGPDIYSRVLCARDESSARRASLSAAFLVIPLSFLLAGLGLLIRAQFPGLPPESALPSALTNLAPAGLKGLIVVGVLGAIMSSADTTLISAATILSLNVMGRGDGRDRAPAASDDQGIRRSSGGHGLGDRDFSAGHHRFVASGLHRFCRGGGPPDSCQLLAGTVGGDTRQRILGTGPGGSDGVGLRSGGWFSPSHRGGW